MSSTDPSELATGSEARGVLLRPTLYNYCTRKSKTRVFCPDSPTLRYVYELLVDTVFDSGSQEIVN
jgi:hypothetical protein